MNAILLTVFVGFVLVSLFVVMFLKFRRDAVTSSPERDSLMPLEEEFTIPADKSPSREVEARAARPVR